MLASFSVAFVFFVIQKEASILVMKQDDLPGLIICICNILISQTGPDLEHSCQGLIPLGLFARL